MNAQLSMLKGLEAAKRHDYIFVVPPVVQWWGPVLGMHPSQSHLDLAASCRTSMACMHLQSRRQCLRLKGIFCSFQRGYTVRVGGRRASRATCSCCPSTTSMTSGTSRSGARTTVRTHQRHFMRRPIMAAKLEADKSCNAAFDV